MPGRRPLLPAGKEATAPARKKQGEKGWAGGVALPRTTADLEAEVQQLLADVEGLMLEAGGQFPAGELLRALQDVTAKLAPHRPGVAPARGLELEIALKQVRARLEAERMELQWRNTRPVGRLLTYQVLWLAVIVLAAALGYTAAARLPQELQVLLGCLGWGAIGAIFCSIVALVRRRADGTLAPQYESWHLVKPLVGGFSGGITYLLMAGGIKFFEPADASGAAGGLISFFGAVAPRAYLAYLFSALMGFQERAFFAKLEQLIKTLLGMNPPAGQPLVVCCCCCKDGQPGSGCPGQGAPCPDCGPADPVP